MTVKEQIAVIRYSDDDVLYSGGIMHVLLVKNYDFNFEDVLNGLEKIYEQNDGIFGPKNERIDFEDFVLQQISAAGYVYEFTGFEEFIVS